MEGIVYHGSPYSGIKKMNKRISTHGKQCIYATDNEVIALLFTSRGNGDLDVAIGLDDVGLPYVIERRPGILNKLYNTSGYIYELDGQNFNHYEYLWSPEVISFKEEQVIRERKIDNILEELMSKADQGLISIFKYPNRIWQIPLDNSDLIEKYVDYYNNGHENAVNDLLHIYPQFEDKVEEILLKKGNKKL